MFLCSSSFSQKLVKELRKKNFGTYQGEIPAYSFVSDTNTIDVAATPIEIIINADYVAIAIGKSHKKGSYRILFKTKDYYVIDALFEGDLLVERLILYEKTGKITREGTYPQPSAIVSKYKKK